ncbi:MAG TPA: type II toxin-antitoxin system RelE/ParE family toxin [Desulfomicrobiaceae bacterium]|nr:type II toxin-antitoxin system RelE/ParE family toxin [Desulfomicrobiaceae bacterium]
MTTLWTLRLSAQADLDIMEILAWTTEYFGASQAETYAETITSALEHLTQGPTVLGVKNREDIAPGIRSLHVARAGRKGRHMIIFRTAPPFVDVLRILHDSMDMAIHIR